VLNAGVRERIESMSPLKFLLWLALIVAGVALFALTTRP
jgi:hypothetical protein